MKNLLHYHYRNGVLLWVICRKFITFGIDFII